MAQDFSYMFSCSSTPLLLVAMRQRLGAAELVGKPAVDGSQRPHVSPEHGPQRRPRAPFTCWLGVRR
ncbi:MAG: hypothetical protein WB802_09195 [Candidatus Dormiibacterota bacterium]